MVPVRQAGDDDPFEIGEDCVERFAAFRRAIGKRRADVSRLDARKNRVTIGLLEIIRDPVGDAIRVLPEVVLTTDLSAPP
jgi:hypothetical protein